MGILSVCYLILTSMLGVRDILNVDKLSVWEFGSGSTRQVVGTERYQPCEEANRGGGLSPFTNGETKAKRDYVWKTPQMLSSDEGSNRIPL